jgi:plasmid stabilization system protein ParE
VRVFFHPRAAEDAATIESWWRANRSAAPELFVLELREVLALVSATPTLGRTAEVENEFPNVRRVLMRRSRYHLYFRVMADTLEVLAIWHTARGQGPTFGRTE